MMTIDDIMTPITPIRIPKITTNPSLPIIPNEIIKIPNPGIKLENGTGKAIDMEKIRVKHPITLSDALDVMNNKRGLKTLSILRKYGEDFCTTIARIDLLIDRLEILLGNFGEEQPNII